MGRALHGLCNVQIHHQETRLSPDVSQFRPRLRLKLDLLRIKVNDRRRVSLVRQAQEEHVRTFEAQKGKSFLVS